MTSSLKPVLALLSLAAFTMLAGTGCAGDEEGSKSANGAFRAHTPEPAADIATLAGDLRTQIEGSAGPGRNRDFEHLEGSSSMELLKSLVVQLSEDDPDRLRDYVYETDKTEFALDAMNAGLFKSAAAVKAAVGEALRSTFENAEPELPDGQTFSIDAFVDKVSAKIDELARAGAVFAYDGFQQNGCAGPTPFLIVIDPAKKVAFGTDLSPCEE